MYKGTVHGIPELPLLQLSPCAIRGVPWLAYSVKAVSDLNKLRSSVALTWQQIGRAPLWNSRVLTVGNQTVTCRHFIERAP